MKRPKSKSRHIKVESKVCTECKRELNVKLFRMDWKYIDAHFPVCKQCVLKYVSEHTDYVTEGLPVVDNENKPDGGFGIV